MKRNLPLLLITGLLLTSCGKEEISPSELSPSSVTVNTVAGSGTPGSTNGAGTAASFYQPTGIATDASGNIYVADFGNNMIRKIGKAGVVTTLAGSGTQGSANGTGAAASFYQPTGVAADASGNIYVADNDNNQVRKITPGGVVTTLAGSGTKGSVNGTGTAAEFAYPLGVATDAAGNVYVADFGNNLIRKITPAGVVSTLAGSGTAGAVNGTGTAAAFNQPSALAIDASGNIYVADYGNNLVRKISTAGVVTTLAGSGSAGSANGNGTAASFNNPQGIAVDASGNVYVADYGNNLVREISPAGAVTTLGSGNSINNNTGNANPFATPYGIAVDATGNVYISDYSGSTIEEISR